MTDTVYLGDDRILRDHTEPCEHPLDPLGMFDGSFFDEESGWRCGQCPGGKIVRMQEVVSFTISTPSVVTVEGGRLWVEMTDAG